jgi:LysM repeat protein
MRIGILSFLMLLSITGFVRASIDSIGIQEVDGKQFIVHQVQPGQNLNYLQNRYNVTLKQIENANPTVTEIRAYDYILIPYSEQASTEQTPLRRQPREQDNVEKPTEKPERQKPSKDRKVHRVESGQTMFSISRMYDVSIDDIKKWNDLEDYNISVGQELYVSPPGGDSRHPGEMQKEKKIKAGEDIKLPDETEPGYMAEQPKEVKSKEEKEHVSKANEQGYHEVIEEGKASWIDEGLLDDRRSLAMHPTAQVGTIIQVKNLMNNRVAYVRVVGKLPDTPENKDLIIKISSSAAEKLDVRDPYFRAELKYAGKDNS